ncbi:MAG: right-handed parallel beta-helix repeat-containing protein [Thermoplasmata archaeon]|nr:MAG: right-handed parallel beta-helix repeat-containing protein [Thermoplasmata archaeon]
MERTFKTVIIVCSLVFAGLFGIISLETEIASAGTILHVRGGPPGNYSNIQDAINASSDGDTILVYNGTYYENIVVNKTINLIGAHWSNTTIVGDGTGDVVYVNRSWVNITGFTITNGGPAPGDAGVELDTVNNCNISFCNISDNLGDGIFVSTSTNNNINNNSVHDNEYGIFLGQAPDNILRDNTIDNNAYNFGVRGLAVLDYHQDIDISNTINGKPIYYIIGQSGLVFDETTPVGYLGLISCENIEVKNLVLTNNYHGILLVNTTNSTITNLTLFDNYYGAYLYLNSINNSITDSYIHDNFWVGIGLEFSHDNRIEWNMISNNDYGLRFLVTVNNTIYQNYIQDNNYGIYLGSSINITVYHNNLINNTIQAMDDEINKWNIAPPFGGNFWSDWYFPDDDCDGFVDYPRIIPISEEAIIITEIMKNPVAVGDTQGEWFEIYNAGTTTVDINDWEIKDSGVIDSHIINNGGPLTIAPGEYLVLGINASYFENGGVLVDYEYSNFVLANLDDEIILMDGLVEMDRVEYDDGTNWPSPTGASMELLDYTKDNNDYTNWQETPPSEPYGMGDYGTPGRDNTGLTHSRDNFAYTYENSWYTGWFNKSVYMNYAPMGMPDFDQREKALRTGQDYWKTINAGQNGVLDSGPLTGDDVLVNSSAGQNNVSIAPGANHVIDTPLGGDDTLEYSYCGPTAAVNGLWWLDSKFADPIGTQGDGNDDHSLVPDLGGGDDHARDNVQFLIEELAELFKTNETGSTTVSNMVDGLNQWFDLQGQRINYTAHSISWPMWEKVAEEVRKCNVAILFLGFYDDEGNRTYGHIVTVSGVNQGGFMIAISDPIKNAANPIADFSSYNDPLNVSHDIYIVLPGPPPIVNPPPSWMLLESYTSGYGFPMPPIYYAVVEEVVIISPIIPTVDYIEITDVPDGTPLTGGIISVGFSEWGNCSLYNNTVGYMGTVNANWTVQGGTSSLLGPTPDVTNGVYVGTTGATVWLNVSYDVFNDSVQYDVLSPTVDYMEITDTPGGTPLGDKTVILGFSEWGNCSLYNNSIGYFKSEDAEWSAFGGNSTLLNVTPTVMNGIYVGTIPGTTVWLNASYYDGNNWHNDSVVYIIPTVDYINITDAPDGTTLSGGIVPVSYQEWGYCSGYNITEGYIGIVYSDWTTFGGASLLLGTTPATLNGIDVGGTAGFVWLNASFQGHNASVKYNVSTATIDYIRITDVSGGTPLMGGIVPIGFLEWGNCSAYNDTIGFLYAVSADWTAEGGTSQLLNVTTPKIRNGIDVGSTLGFVWLNASYNGHTYSVRYNVTLPTLDYVEITDTPGGTPLEDGIVPLDYQEWGNFSLYNDTIGYYGIVAANWTAQGGLSSLLDIPQAVMNGIDVGNTSGTVWLNASYYDGINWYNDSVIYIIPTIDYIDITDIPNGTPLSGGVVPMGFEQWGNCSAYNDTEGFIGTVAADWTAQGGGATLLGPTPGHRNGIYVGITIGTTWLNASYLGLNDSVVYIIPSPYDFINITDIPDGTPLVNKTVPVGYIEWGNCSLYNLTAGFIGVVDADWTVEGGNATLLGSSPNIMNGIDVGTIPGFVWLNASYYGINDSVRFYVISPTVDYIRITDVPDGTSLAGGNVPVGFIEWGNCSAYNNTVGYMGTLNANWTAEGGTSILIGSSQGHGNGIDVGLSEGEVWFNASYFDGVDWHYDSVIYILTPTVDYIQITDIPDGYILGGGIVPINFSEWGNCSAYNNTAGFLQVMIANWTVVGGNAILTGSAQAAYSGIDVGTVPGLVWFNASYDVYNASIQYEVLSQQVDRIEITDIPNGTNLTGGFVMLGFVEWGNCSAYNDTGDYIGTVNARWTVEGGSAQLLGPSPAKMNGIDGGFTPGTIWFKASYYDGTKWHNDSVMYIILIVDRIEITDTPNGTILEGGLVMVGFLEWGNCSAYNDTEGFISTVIANWTVEGGLAQLLGPTPSETNGIDIGTTPSIVWFNASYNGHKTNVVYVLALPSSPQNVSKDSGKSFIHLSWKAPESNGSAPITGYIIYRGDAADNLTKVTEVVDIFDYNDTGVVNGVTYYYAVSANTNIGEGPKSDAIPITAGLVPSAPYDLMVTPGTDQITLTWKAPLADGGLNITNYQIYRGYNPNEITFWEKIGNVTSYTDFLVFNETIYYYQVQAVNDLGAGLLSNADSAELMGLPSEPTTLIATAGDSVVHLSWGAPHLIRGSAVTNYRIYKGESPDDMPTIIDIDDSLFYDDYDVTNNITYYYKVSAINAIGEGPFSNVDDATPTVPPLPVNMIPTCTISTPSTEAVVNGTILINGTASDSDGTIQLIQIRIDENDWINITGNESWSYELDTTELPNGRHSIAVRSFDGEDYSPAASISIIVDNPPSPKEKSFFEEAGPWLLLVVIIILLLILLLLILRRRKKEEGEEEEEELEEEEEEELDEDLVEELLEEDEEEPEEELDEDFLDEEEPEEELEEELMEEEEEELEDEEEPKEELKEEELDEEAGEEAEEEAPKEELEGEGLKKEAEVDEELKPLGYEGATEDKEESEKVSDEEEAESDKKASSEEEKGEDETEVFECPECGANISSTDSVCPKCGTEFVD